MINAKNIDTMTVIPVTVVVVALSVSISLPPASDLYFAHGVILRTKLNILSTIFAGVGSLHVSSAFTTHFCRSAISLQKVYFQYQCLNMPITVCDPIKWFSD